MHLLVATHPDEAVDVSFQYVICMTKGRGIRRGAGRGYSFPGKQRGIRRVLVEAIYFRKR
jgi:hypothetical protein